jgi:hypothetical protein
MKLNSIIAQSLINIACFGQAVLIFMEVENTMKQILESLQSVQVPLMPFNHI